MKQMTVAIIGAGSVGATTAFTLLMKNFPCDIILIDIDKERCLGEVKDLTDAQEYSSLSSITSGSIRDAQQADIIIIAAGCRQQPGQSRLELLNTNMCIIHSIFTSFKRINQHAIIIMVTNPVDILTQYAVEHSGLPVNQVLGSGTLLETRRLHKFIAKSINMSEKSIHGYVIGEHGDDALATWQTIMADGKTLIEYDLSQKELNELEKYAKQEADEIINRKGATYFGVATCVAQVCEAIIFNQNLALPVSCYVDRFKTCLSIPCIINKQGIYKELELPLNHKQQQTLETTAAKLNTLYENAIKTVSKG